MGTFTHTPAPTDAEKLAAAQAVALKRLNDAYDAAARPLVRDYPEVERLGWTQQLSEATAYQAWLDAGEQGEAPATPALAGILRGRNGTTGTETLADLCRAVLTRADAMIQWQEFTGVRHRGEWTINDAQTPDEALAVTWEKLVAE
ncbi:hypothetical protein [Salinicola endophyticus]|uniref:Uncharacterized protein n=1 Tax=Salinicola endophyticus TaxID=1949083 RepID=A0AB74U2B7_9GAMM